MSRFFAVVLVLCATPALADNFKKISDRDTFVRVVQDRALSMPLFGVDLRVFEAGHIAGRAWGREMPLVHT